MAFEAIFEWTTAWSFRGGFVGTIRAQRSRGDVNWARGLGRCWNILRRVIFVWCLVGTDIKRDVVDTWGVEGLGGTCGIGFFMMIVGDIVAGGLHGGIIWVQGEQDASQVSRWGGEAHLEGGDWGMCL